MEDILSQDDNQPIKRKKRGWSRLDAQGRKFCPKCETYKKLSEYTPIRRRRFGVEIWCKACMAEYQRGRYRYDKAKNTALKSMYGLSLAEYNEMLDAQGGVCAICGQPETIGSKFGHSRTPDCTPVLNVDHCHTTGAVRGLLCSPCNQALGLLAEDPDRVKAMLKYIEEKVLW